MKIPLSALAMLSLIALEALPAHAQSSYKYQTPMVPGVATPDKVETSIGTLHLTDGYPDAGTVQKIYDNLDTSRALQAYLLALPIVNQAGMREAASITASATFSSPVYATARFGGLRGTGGMSTASKIAANIDRGFCPKNRSAAVVPSGRVRQKL